MEIVIQALAILSEHLSHRRRGASACLDRDAKWEIVMQIFRLRSCCLGDAIRKIGRFTMIDPFCSEETQLPLNAVTATVNSDWRKARRATP